MRGACGVAVSLLAASCAVGLPSDAKDDLPPIEDPNDPPQESDTPTPEAPEPRCAWTEAEPNNTADLALDLPLETRACGDYNAAFDADFWSVSLAEEGWLALDLAGYSVGSEAWVSLTVSRPDLGWSLGAFSYRGLPEAHLLVPAPAGTWLLMSRQTIGEGGGQGEGADFFYELRASASKPPLDWDRTESGTNGSAASPDVLSLSVGAPQTVYGVIDASGASDFYAVDLPAGSWRLGVAVAAHDLGSPGDFGVELRAPGAAAGATFSSGRLTSYLDPVGEIAVSGPGRALVRVFEDADGGMPLSWYAATVTVEAP